MSSRKRSSRGSIPLSQLSQKSKGDSKKKETLTSTEFQQKINDTVANILRLNSNGHSITRTQILSNFKGCRGADAVGLINAIGNVLDWNFGLKLVECDYQKFILVNKLQHPMLFEVGSKEKVLLLLILSLIIHNNGSVAEDELVEHLSKLSIQMKDDSYFGKTDKKILELERQMFLKKNTPKELNGKATYVLGKRTKKDVNKNELLAHLGKVNNCSVTRIKEVLNPFHSVLDSSSSSEESDKE